MTDLEEECTHFWCSNWWKAPEVGCHKCGKWENRPEIERWSCNCVYWEE